MYTIPVGSESIEFELILYCCCGIMYSDSDVPAKSVWAPYADGFYEAVQSA